MKIRKKPMTLDAWRIDTLELQNAGDTPDWVWKAWKEDKTLGIASGGHDLVLHIKTLEGVMTANDGDILVKGFSGELYSIKSSIFDQTYDVLDAENVTQPSIDFEYDTGFPIPTIDVLNSPSSIEVVSITDTEDGGATVVVDMDYDTMKLFAKKGVYQALVDAAKRANDEHGLS